MPAKVLEILKPGSSTTCEGKKSGVMIFQDISLFTRSLTEAIVRFRFLFYLFITEFQRGLCNRTSLLG
jgi:hypothetical protein